MHKDMCWCVVPTESHVAGLLFSFIFSLNVKEKVVQLQRHARVAGKIAYANWELLENNTNFVPNCHYSNRVINILCWHTDQCTLIEQSLYLTL